MRRLKSQNAMFHGLIGKLKLDPDDKKSLVKQVSAGRCESSRDLTAHEMQKAIDHLSGNYDSKKAKMQAKIRTIAADIGLLGSGNDYTALNSFILKKFKVPTLFNLDYDNLRNCITALERWRDSKTKKQLGI